MHSSGLFFLVFIVVLLPGFAACSSASSSAADRPTGSGKVLAWANPFSNDSHMLLDTSSTLDRRAYVTVTATYLSEVVGIKVAQSWRSG